jgi:hypothetical protein
MPMQMHLFRVDLAMARMIVCNEMFVCLFIVSCVYVVVVAGCFVYAAMRLTLLDFAHACCS